MEKVNLSCEKGQPFLQKTSTLSVKTEMVDCFDYNYFKTILSLHK